MSDARIVLADTIDEESDYHQILEDNKELLEMQETYENKGDVVAKANEVNAHM